MVAKLTARPMGDNPLISVIIPSYNCAQFVVRAVRSALAQTYRPLEVIVVDDGSTDDTRQLLVGFRDQVRYIYQTNKGLPGARNTGIRHARGELLAFLDADDEWQPDKLVVQAAVLSANPQAALVHSDLIYLDVSTDRRFQENRPRERFQGRCYEALFFGSHVTPSTVLVRKDCVESVGMFDESLVGGCEDYDLWLRLARRHEFAYEPRPLTLYRLHTANMSRNDLKMSHALLTVVDKTLAADPDLKRRLGRRRTSRRLYELCFLLGYAHFDRGQSTEARRYFSRALRHRPGNGYLWSLWLSTFLPAGLVRRLRSLKQRMTGRETSVPPNRGARALERVSVG